jgi:hypothetical protein
MKLMRRIADSPRPVSDTAPDIQPGDRIRITEKIVSHDEKWLTEVEGMVLSCRPEPTESWFARRKDDKLWLLRIRLRKDDGEITALVVDQNSELEVLAPQT